MNSTEVDDRVRRSLDRVECPVCEGTGRGWRPCNYCGRKGYLSPRDVQRNCSYSARYEGEPIWDLTIRKLSVYS